MDEILSSFVGHTLERPSETALAVLVPILLLAVFFLVRARARTKAQAKLAREITRRVLAEMKREQPVAEANVRAVSLPSNAQRIRRDAREHRVRLFIDYPNFAEPLRNAVRKGGRTAEVDWIRLPPVLLKRLSEIVGIKEERFRLVGSYVYDSFIPYQTLVEHGEHGNAEQHYRYNDKSFLVDTLATTPGYFVHLSDRTLKIRNGEPVRNNSGAMVTQEKAVDTRLTTDLLMGSFNGTYDVALLLSDDNDYVPPAEAVYERFGTVVIHVGFQKLKRGLGAASWGDVIIDAKLASTLRKNDGIRELLRTNANSSAPSTPSVPQVEDTENVDGASATATKKMLVVGSSYEALVDARPPSGLVVAIENSLPSVLGPIRWKQVRSAYGSARLNRGDAVRVRITALSEGRASCVLLPPVEASAITSCKDLTDKSLGVPS